MTCCDAVFVFMTVNPLTDLILLGNACVGSTFISYQPANLFKGFPTASDLPKNVQFYTFTSF